MSDVFSSHTDAGRARLLELWCTFYAKAYINLWKSLKLNEPGNRQKRRYQEITRIRPRWDPLHVGCSRHQYADALLNSTVIWKSSIKAACYRISVVARMNIIWDVPCLRPRAAKFDSR